MSKLWSGGGHLERSALSLRAPLRLRIEREIRHLRSVYNFNDGGSSKSIFSAVYSDGNIVYADDADDMICVLIGFCL